MQKKLEELNEAFERLQFQECLVMIEQIYKKFSKPDKKKQQALS